MEKTLILAVVATIVGGFSPAYAATTTPPIVTVATVNLVNAAITAQNGNTVDFSFDLTNRTGVEPQVRYGVLLEKQAGGATQVIDEKVYDATLNLGESDTQHITASYTPGGFADGEYALVAEARNVDGLILGLSPIGTVTFKSSGGSLFINPSSCYLTVKEDVTTAKYSVAQGVDVLPSETLVAHCDTVASSFADTETATPVFTTYYRSIFGNTIAVSTGTPASFPGKGSTSQAFTITKATDPQAYDAVLVFKNPNGDPVSNTIDFHYVIDGESASIQNLVFNTDHFAPGDTAGISVLWTGPADSFPGARFEKTTSSLNPTPSFTVEASIADGTGALCADPLTTKIDQANGPIAKVSLPITTSCVAPVAKIRLQDTNGAVLAENSVALGRAATSSAVAAGGAASSSGGSWWLTLLIVAIVLIIFTVTLSVVVKKKKDATTAAAIGLLFLVGGCLAITAARPAKADTFTAVSSFMQGGYNGSAVHIIYVTYSVGLNKSQYTPGEEMQLTGSSEEALCSNGANLTGSFPSTMKVTTNGKTKTIFTSAFLPIGATVSINAPEKNGSYTADFDSSGFFPTGYGGWDIQAWGTHPLDYTVAGGYIKVHSRSAKDQNVSIPASWQVVRTDGPGSFTGSNESDDTYSASAGTWKVVPQDMPGYVASVVPAPQALSGDGTLDLTILWNPVASMSLMPSTLSLKYTAPNGTITMANTGPRGSVLSWNASPSAPWITVSPMSGSLNGGATTPLTIGFDATKVPVGATSGSVNIGGTSTADGSTVSPTAVTLNVTVPPGPACDRFDIYPKQIVLPETGTLSYHCMNVTSCALSTGDTVVINDTTASGTVKVAPTSTANYTLSCNGILHNNVSYTTGAGANLQVTNPNRVETNPNP